MTADNLQMTAAAAFVTGDFSIVQSSWSLFTQYADYLVGHGLDPTAQLCSDDFEGPSPHNANLAAKSIIGIAVYASLCDATNRTCGKKYMAVATDCAYCTSAVPATHHITSLVLGLKRYSFVRLIFTVHTDAVPFFNKLVDDVDVSSVGSSSVEFPVAVVKHDRPLAFKGFALRLEMCQVYDVLVTSL
jgi:hypothetical protein